MVHQFCLLISVEDEKELKMQSSNNTWTDKCSYHMPLPIVYEFASTGNLETMLVFELDFNASIS